jgi:hypothetical protein
MGKKLTDTLTGGIYEYFFVDNGETVYTGSTEHVEDKWGAPLEKVDKWHRVGETFPTKYPYSWTVFRTNLRDTFGERVDIRWKDEPKEMSREELLTLETKRIKEAKKIGQSYLNHHNDPLAAWKKYNAS